MASKPVRLVAGALLAVMLAVFATAAGVAGLVTAVSGAGIGASTASVSDIPDEYLRAYQGAATHFDLGPDGWAYLAGLGKVETDHGRLQAPGVLSGQNAHGCCAGPMQIHNGFGTGTATWAQYRTDGDGDGRTDIYDVEDAVFTAANLERASGAPADWRRAIFAYNHAGWYVEKVLSETRRYLAAAAAPPHNATVDTPLDGTWLAPLPGFPGERCDRRIVRDVMWLATTFGLTVSDCFGGQPHARGGEHPLGLAIDASPADGDWRRTELVARRSGWAPTCATSGCPGRGPFRVVLYNGYPGHGDPRHTDSPHLHLSWEHAPAAPFSPASSVRVITRPTGGGR